MIIDIRRILELAGSLNAANKEYETESFDTPEQYDYDDENDDENENELNSYDELKASDRLKWELRNKNNNNNNTSDNAEEVEEEEENVGTYDYGHDRDEDPKKGYKNKTFKYTGREEHGWAGSAKNPNNPFTSPMLVKPSKDQYSYDFMGENSDLNDNEIPVLRYKYNVTSSGNVVIKNNNTGFEAFVTGEDADNLLRSLEAAGEDQRRAQLILSNYENNMSSEGSEQYKELMLDYNNFKNGKKFNDVPLDIVDNAVDSLIQGVSLEEVMEKYGVTKHDIKEYITLFGAASIPREVRAEIYDVYENNDMFEDEHEKEELTTLLRKMGLPNESIDNLMSEYFPENN